MPSLASRPNQQLNRYCKERGESRAHRDCDRPRYVQTIVGMNEGILFVNNLSFSTAEAWMMEKITEYILKIVENSPVLNQMIGTTTYIVPSLLVSCTRRSLCEVLIIAFPLFSFTRLRCNHKKVLCFAQT